MVTGISITNCTAYVLWLGLVVMLVKVKCEVGKYAMREIVQFS